MNQEYKVNLSQGQKAKLAKAIKDGSALKLRLGKNALSGPDELFLSPRQIAKLQKAKKNNTGAEISFSKSSIRKSVKQGGSLWTSLLKLVVVKKRFLGHHQKFQKIHKIPLPPAQIQQNSSELIHLC